MMGSKQSTEAKNKFYVEKVEFRSEKWRRSTPYVYRVPTGTARLLFKEREKVN
jgi:hypothetical protein